MWRFAIIAVLVAEGPTAAQQPAPRPAVTATTPEATQTVHTLVPPLNFDRLGYTEGLPNLHITAIAQDTIGFLWFGTQDGLARYDSAQMRVYRPVADDPSSLSAGYITALALDTSGLLWVGTAENGVNLYDPKTDRFTRFAQGDKDGLTSNGVTAIVRDRKDRIWLAMADGGLNRFDPQTRKFVAYRTKPLDAIITAIDVDATGNLWLGTEEVGLIRWNPDNNAVSTYPPSSTSPAPITAVRVTADGRVWIGTAGNGVAVLDVKSQRVVEHRHDTAKANTISDDRIRVLFEDRDHNLWIGTENGLDQMTPSGAVERYAHDPNDPTSLAFPRVESMFQDAGGVMWIGGFTAGLCRFDEFRRKFGRYRTRTHPVNSFFEEADGSLWVGTYHGGLYKYDWRTQRATLFHQLTGGADSINLESAWIAALHRDRRGTLWISLAGVGLVAFNPDTGAFTKFVPNPEDDKALPVDTVWDIWEDPAGILWLASWGGGLVRFDPQTRVFATVTGETAYHLYTLYPDGANANILWLGAAKGGLVRFDMAANTSTSFRARPEDPSGLASDDVLSIHKDPAGMMWVGTYGGGLNRLDPATGKVTRFTRASSGLTNDVILGILPDDDGKLWLSTNGGGLVHFDPKTAKFFAYDESDGVQGKEFAQGAFMKSKSGKLFFGGVNGFNTFFPRDIKRDTYVPPVVLTSFKLFNDEVALARPIWTLPPLELSYADSFELQFAALSYAAPHKNRYAYKLEGFDEDFIETDRPFATYTKLDGGTYKLRVRAANRHGVWNEAGVAFEFHVEPPFWKSWPAYVVYGLLVIGAAILVSWVQRQRVRRVEREGRLAVIERDLALTGAVQSGFLPDHNEIENGHLHIFGFYRAADACSGDWWWHETIGARHVVLVGDVTGHGPGPAMVTAAVATAFRVLKVNGLDDMRHALQVLNNVVLDVAKGKYHMTMAALEVDETTGQWVLHSAGAPPIISLATTGKHRVHLCAGTPLGVDTAFSPGRVEGRLQPSERILICTDGIPEILLPNGSAMGMRRLAQAYEKTRNQPLKDAAMSIVQHADGIKDGKPQDDDWTFTLIEWSEAPKGADLT